MNNFFEHNVSLEKCPALVLNADYRPLSYYPLSLWSWQDTVKSVFLDKLISATIRMYYYSFNMEEEVRQMRKIVTEYRADKTRAVERARVAEKKIETLEKKLKTLKL